MSDEIPWIDEPVDAGTVEIIIEDAIIPIHQLVSRLAEDISAPLLKAEFSARAKPDEFEFQAENIDQIRDSLRSIRDRLFYGEERILSQITEAHEACLQNAIELRKRWMKAADLSKSMAELATRLQHMVVALEAEKNARVQEHNPSSPGLRANVLALTGGKCAYCDAEITSDSSDGNANFVIEHVVPKSCGGPDHFANYVPACSKCNAQKSAGHVLEFIQRRLVSARVELAEAAE